MATSSTSITSLQALKRYLRLTTSDDDRLLTELLDAATNRIEGFCQRVFIDKNYKQFVSGSGNGTLSLPNFPVTAIRRIGWERKNAMTVTNSSATDLRASVEVQDNGIVLKRWDSVGAETQTTITFADYLTTSLMATQISTIANWTATADETVLCDELMRQGGQDATSSAQLYYLNSTDADYRVDEDSGRINLLSAQSESQWFPFDPNAMSFPRGSSNIFVDYSAGYTQATVPVALQEIAWELVSSAYHGGKHDPTVASESLDGYSYSTRNAMELRDDQMRRMYQYRRNAE